jgi:hypothetical protein
MTLAAGVTVLMSQAVKAEPLVLTPAQMDDVTAGGVFVDVAAFAGASGDDFARALTDTDTKLVVGPWYQVGQGMAVASSLACCGSDAEAVAATLAGADENVRSSTHMNQGGFLVVAFSVVTVFVSSWTPGGVFHSASLAGAEMSP